MRFLIGLVTLCLLPACIEGDVTLDFADAGGVAARSKIRFPTRFLNALGAEPLGVCAPGDVVETETAVTCFGTAWNRMEAVRDGQIDIGTLGGSLDLAEYVTVEESGAQRLRVSVDLEALVVAIRSTDLRLLTMASWLNASLGGGDGLTIRIRASDIVATTGGLSYDGHEAQVHIPPEQFYAAEPWVGGPFITVIDNGDSCFLAFFC